MSAGLLRRCECGRTYELLTMGTPCPDCGDHLAGRRTGNGKGVPSAWPVDELCAAWKVYDEGWSIFDVGKALGFTPDRLAIAWRRLGFPMRSQPETYRAKRLLLQSLFRDALQRHGIEPPEDLLERDGTHEDHDRL